VALARLRPATVAGGGTIGRMHPVAFLIGKGATPKQASAVIWGSGVSVVVPVGLWFVDKPVAQAVLIVIAISAPRAIVCLVAQWGRSGGDAIFPESFAGYKTRWY
jgi:hypothetical protein